MKEPYKIALVVNGFLKTGKFLEIYEWLENAAKAGGCIAQCIDNTALMTEESVERLKREYDLCIFWDKDIPLARRIEKTGMKVINSSRAIEICDDKLLTYETLRGEGIAMPKTLAIPFTYENVGYTDLGFLTQSEERLGYPFVIQENNGSFGGQVYLAGNRREATEILGRIKGAPALCQEYISESSGRDIRINMVGDKCVAAMERYNESDFRANVTNGGRMRPYEPAKEEIELSLRVMKSLDLSFAGIDILHSDRGPLLCEVNSNAHFKSIYECTGINVANEIIEYAKGLISA